MRRPCGVVVSAHVPFSERKPAFAFATASSTLSKSRVDLASRSSRVTINTSPSSSAASTLRSCARSVLAPLAISRNTLTAAAAVKAATDHELVEQTALRKTADFAEGVKAVNERRAGMFVGA